MPYRVFNVNEVADYLHLSREDVEDLVHDGEIPCERMGDRLVFRKQEIDAWASRRILGFPEGKLKSYHAKTSARYHDLSSEHAIVTELLRPEFIEAAMTSRTKPSLLRDLVDRAARTGLVTNAGELLATISEREKLGSTALSGGVALVHPRNQEPYRFEDSFVLLGRAVQPLPFGSPDGATTDLFFLMCCQDDRIHLHVLARLCMMCQQTALLLELRDAQDAAGMHRAVAESEREVIIRLPRPAGGSAR
jgi:PTS system nitrogen regulatory IIA component